MKTDLSLSEKKRLAADLEKERDKIVVSNKSSKLMEAKKQEIEGRIKQEEERRKFALEKAFNNESRFVRFLYKIKEILSRVPAQELYQESLLQDLRTKVLRSTRSNVLASGNKLSGKFVARLYRAYIEADFFREPLSLVFKGSKILELYTRYAFKNLFQINMKRDLSEIISLDELRKKIENLHSSAESPVEGLEEYLSACKADIRNYIGELNPTFIAEVSKSFNDLYHLYLFTKFEYKKFFTTMGGTAKSFESGEFSDTPLSVTMKKHLENFYQYVPMLAGLWSANTDPASSILVCATISKGYEEAFEEIYELVRKDEAGYIKKLRNFSKNWTTDICNYPFLDLIRLVGLNSFYEPRVNDLPNLNLKPRIKKFVEQQLLFELESFVNKIYEEYNSEAQQKFLIDYGEESMLEYYSQRSIMNTGRFHGIPGFAHVYSINMLYNFLSKYYVINIKKVFVHLVRGVLPKNSNLRSAVLNQSVRIDNFRERIRAFNTSLNPESRWGKSLMNIVYRLEKKDTGNLLKQVREQLKEIDTEAEDIIEQGLAIFQSAMAQLQSLMVSENAKMKEAMTANLPDTNVSLFVAIEKALHAFSGISNLIRSIDKRN